MSNPSDDDEEILETIDESFMVKSEEDKMSNTSDEDVETLDTRTDPAKAVLIPAKSRERYQAVYEAFVQWKKTKRVRRITENIILEYFCELAKKYKPPTLWSTYSMLRCTLNIHEKIHLENFKHLSAWLKIKSTGYRGRQSKVFSAKDIETFLETAPDCQYLATKVILIFGISGSCQSAELLKLTVDDIMNRGDVMVVKVRDKIAKTVRSFIIEGEYLKKTLEYQALRPPNTATNRVFINYHSGRCTNQPIGKNKLGRMPREIAKFLKLPNPEQYTGHSFRRSSAHTSQVCADEDVQSSETMEIQSSERIEIQRLGGWCTVTEGDIDDSAAYKRQNGQQISTTMDDPSMNTVMFEEGPTKRIKTEMFDTEEDSATSTAHHFLADEAVTDNENTATTSIDWNGRTVALHFTNCSTVNIKFVN